MSLLCSSFLLISDVSLLLKGDAYICTANLFDGDKFGGNVKDAALSALNMAKDMILATQEVIKPTRIGRRRNSVYETLEIRVGIHVGEVTCGVLGERLPKFTVFGHNVNLAARMEQTSKPNMIRVTEVFRRLVAGVDDNWDEFEVISMKNMGSIGTYIMDPTKQDGFFM
jgi:class 3 adenylate cyclase